MGCRERQHNESSHHLLVQADILSVLQDRPIDRAGRGKGNWIGERKEDVSRCTCGSGRGEGARRLGRGLTIRAGAPERRGENGIRFLVSDY